MTVNNRTGDRTLWDSVYSSDSSFFGEEPSVLAKVALPLLEEHHCRTIVELGCGQGRDTVFFARNGFNVHAFDSSGISTSQLKQDIKKSGLEGKVKVSLADLSKALPSIGKVKVDAVYSHLFLCMPLTDSELQRIFDFVYEILPEGGLHIFSVRSKGKDKSYGSGTQVANDTYLINGFTVRFFNEAEILRFNHKFKVLKVSEAEEEPCSLILVFSTKSLQ